MLYSDNRIHKQIKTTQEKKIATFNTLLLFACQKYTEATNKFIKKCYNTIT